MLPRSVVQGAPAVEVSNVTRRFGEVEALRDISLTIPRGEFFSLLGPSGCGKTTLLRIIAGLDFPDTGSLRLGGRNALDVPAHERAVNTVFQSYALFPHLTVQDNVSFGLRMKRVARPLIEQRVRSVMDLMRIGQLTARKPAQLSGGEKQRVALARALVNEPQVLLLDEPLGALDLKLRKELQQELRALQRRIGITFIYVTHDQDEALSMSDRISVMDRGRIVQTGTSPELYEQPRTRFVAQFLGGCNLMPAKVRARRGEKTCVQTPIGDLTLNSTDTRSEFTLAIRPEKISMGPGTNQVEGIISDTIYTGAETRCVVEIAREKLHVVVMNGPGTRPMAKGDTIRLTLPPEFLFVLED